MVAIAFSLAAWGQAAWQKRQGSTSLPMAA
jgi:hypothetical protein